MDNTIKMKKSLTVRHVTSAGAREVAKVSKVSSMVLLIFTLILSFHAQPLNGVYTTSNNNNNNNFNSKSQNNNQKSKPIGVPTFSIEPPNVVLFLSSNGIVIPCHIKASNGQQFTTSWQVLRSPSSSGNDWIDVVNVPGLRLVREDGSLALLPFNDPNEFNELIHTNTYRCIGGSTNDGRSQQQLQLITSRRIIVRSVKQCEWVPNKSLNHEQQQFLQINDNWSTKEVKSSSNNGGGGLKSSSVVQYRSLASSFWFPKITTSDVGKVICSSTNGQHQQHGNNGHDRYEINLTSKLLAPLKVTLVPSNINPVIGEDIILNCTINWSTKDISGHRSGGNGRHNNGHGENNGLFPLIEKEIHFYHNLKRIQFDHRIRKINENIVTIRSFRYSDNGMYQCFVAASTLAPSSSTSGSSFSSSSSSSSTSLVTGDSGSSNLFHQEWFHGDLLLHLPETGPVMVTTFSEQIKIPNSDLSLKCSALGSPLPSFKWKLDGNDISTSSATDRSMSSSSSSSSSHRFIVHESTNADASGTISTLNISSISSMEGGMYECIASNGIGTRTGIVQHKARINVMGSVRVKPVTNITTISGLPFTLSCPFTGYPLHDVHFFKEGKKLPLDDRHTIISMAKVHFNTISKDDSGQYSCVVSSMGNEKSEGIINLKVLAAPVMSPFSFPDNLEEGMRTSVICSVVAGDPPIQLSWYKDGKVIEPSINNNLDNSSIQIISITEFVSSLIITKLDRTYSGNYTCKAVTDVGSVNYTASMMVRSKPIWLLKPTNMAAVAGNGLRLDCLADSYPHPVIRWKMMPLINRRSSSFGSSSSIGSGQVSSSNGGQFGQPLAILSSPRIHVLENGSLIIKSVQGEDAGRYICELSNGVGRSQESFADIIVHEKPLIRPLSSQVTVKQFERIDLICKGEGSLPLNFDWFKSYELKISSSFASSSSPSFGNYVIREEEDSNNHHQSKREKVSILSILSASRNDSTIYSCLASNYYGSDQGDIRVVVQEQPDAPKDVRTTDITSRSITLTWSLPYNGNSPVTGYEIVHKSARENWMEGKTMFISANSVPTSSTSSSSGTTTSNTINSVLVPNLFPLSTYNIRLRAENDLGKSGFSQEITVTTTIEAPQVIPENVTCQPIDSKSIRISWIITGSSPNLGLNSEDSLTEDDEKDVAFIEGFYIGYRVVSSLEPFTYKTMHINSLSSLSSSVGSGNGNNNNNNILHTASSKEDEEGEENKMFTLSDLSITTGHGHHITEITGGHGKGGGRHVKTRRRRKNRRYFEYIIDSLRKGTKYLIIIQAFNSKGAGPSTNEVTIETFANDPPKAPSVRIDGITTNTVTISWKVTGDAAASTVSSALPSSSSSSSGVMVPSNSLSPSSSSSSSVNPEGITGFILYYKKEVEVDEPFQTIRLPKQQRKYILTNLNCGTKYIIKLIAFNEVGNGEPTDDVHFNTEGRPPISPDKYNFIKSNISSVSLNLMSWKDGGCPITSFVIQFKPKSQIEWILLSSHILPEQETVLIRDLNPSSWHDLLVLAKNDAGTTEANFLFATLTKTGATIAPMLLSDSSFGTTKTPFDTIMLLVPSLCIFTVFTVVGFIVIYMIICKKRLLLESSSSSGDHDHYGRHPNDTLSLNSFNSKTPNKVLGGSNSNCEPIYHQHQRVQVYYPSIYGTTTELNSRAATALIRTSSCIDGHHIQGSPTPSIGDYGFNASRLSSSDQTRVLRGAGSKSSNCHRNSSHLYDVPHRMLRKELSSCNTPNEEQCTFNASPINGAATDGQLMWSKTGSKELILDENQLLHSLQHDHHCSRETTGSTSSASEFFQLQQNC